MRFEVEDRGTIQSINPTVSHVIISISDTRETRADPAVNSKCKDVLFLAFHDADRIAPGIDLFTEKQANDVINFYLRYREEVDLVIAHCNAGLCRSPGVIAALQKIETSNDDVWFKRKAPNRLVYNTILTEAFDRGLIGI